VLGGACGGGSEGHDTVAFAYPSSLRLDAARRRLGALGGAGLRQGDLTVYCGVQEEWCRPMVAAFERATGVKVAMTRKSAGEIYASSRPKPPIRAATSGGRHRRSASAGGEENLTEEYHSPC